MSLYCSSWLSSEDMFAQRSVLIHFVLEGELRGDVNPVWFQATKQAGSTGIRLAHLTCRARKSTNPHWTEVLIELRRCVVPLSFTMLKQLINTFFAKLGFSAFEQSRFKSLKVSICTTFGLYGHSREDGDTVLMTYVPLYKPDHKIVPGYFQQYYELCLRQYITFITGKPYEPAIREIRFGLTQPGEEFFNNACSCGKMWCEGMARFFYKPPCRFIFLNESDDNDSSQ